MTVGRSIRGSACSCALAAALAACGGDGGSTGLEGSSASSASASATTGEGGASAGSGGASASATTGNGGASASTSATAASSGAGGSSSSAGTGGSGGAPAGLATLGSLVVLGDSISKGGGQAPYYYDLLHTDLDAKYGAVAYHNNAKSGSKTSDLVSQIDGLPSTLPGPVAVTITSGGNDMKAAIALVFTGLDGPSKMAVSANVKAALDLLLAPDRFGPGVEVHVYEGNIYDASDGAGDFGSHNCNFGQGFPAVPTDPYFDAWNAAIGDEVAAHGQVSADMHAYFYGHGYASNPDWYASDCTHPSAIGHDELHDLFYALITGEQAP